MFQRRLDECLSAFERFLHADDSDIAARPGESGERLRPAQHRQQTQRQHLVERINDFAAPPKIRKIFEIIKKNNCFADRDPVPLPC